MTADRIIETNYPARRITIATGTSFEDFRRRYETAVPAYDAQAFVALVARRASWSEVLEATRRSAPYAFLIYFRIDTQPLMSLAGADARCVEYLMGNHTTAEKMFRHDPRAMLYAPLRTAITAAVGDTEARFSVDQPSRIFDSFGNPEIAAVGAELDHELAALLEHLAVPVPACLRSAG